MAEKSGFFNAVRTDAGYDRKYSAQDWSDFIASFISTGVLRDANNGLYVAANGGFALKVLKGWGNIKGHWYHNDADFLTFSVPTPPVGEHGRIDRIVIRLDNTLETRNAFLVYLQGEAKANATAPELTRTETIYDIVLADINVKASTTEIRQSDIVDTRPDQELCGWVTSPIGYDEYFENLDAAFNTWFTEVRTTLSLTTLFKKYVWAVTLEEEKSFVTFDISQYDPTGVDILDVYANGLKLQKTKDYTLENSVITFTTPKVAGTDILVEVYKSIDGKGMGTVIDEVSTLQQQMSTVKNIGEYIYICNGVDDNIKLSEIAQAFLDSQNNYDQLTINVYGTFGASVPFAGSGTNVSRYRWFSLGSAGTQTKKVTFDFLNCSQITLNCANGYYYIGFYGVGLNIRNASIIANCRNSEGSFEMFSATTGSVNAENCRFTINGMQGCSIAATGTFNNCTGKVINENSSSYCFNVLNNCLLRINNGEYYSYSNSSNDSSVVYIAANTPTAVVITNGMNCPTVTNGSLKQANAYLCNSGAGAFNDTITTLTTKASSSQNVRGTYAVNLPNRS